MTESIYAYIVGLDILPQKKMDEVLIPVTDADIIVINKFCYFRQR